MRLLRLALLLTCGGGLVLGRTWPSLAAILLAMGGVLTTAVAGQAARAAAESPFIALWWRLARRWALPLTIGVALSLDRVTGETAARLGLGVLLGLALWGWVWLGNRGIPVVEALPLPYRRRR